MANRTTGPLWNACNAVFGITRQADPPVVPIPRPVGEQRIDGVHGERADRLQYVCDGRRSGTRVTVVVHHVRKQTHKTRLGGPLHEDITMIAVAGHCREDHGFAELREVTACENARWIVVDRCWRRMGSDLHVCRHDHGLGTNHLGGERYPLALIAIP